MRFLDTCDDRRVESLAIHPEFIITRSSYVDTLPSVQQRGFLLILVFLLRPLGFVHRAPPSELTCVEFVLMLPQVILKSSSEKTRHLRSIMFSIRRANSLQSMNSVLEDLSKGELITKYSFYDF